jgi:hypothetical protein
VETKSVVFDGDSDDLADDRDRGIRLEIAAAEEIEVAGRAVNVEPESKDRGSFEYQPVAMRRDSQAGQESFSCVERCNVVERFATPLCFIQESLSHRGGDVRDRLHPASTSR